jgi:hypothetical protein
MLIEVAIQNDPRGPGLLMHNGLNMVRSADGPTIKRIPSPEEEAERGLYRLPDGQLFVPAEALRSAMIDAGVGQRLKLRALGKVAAENVFCDNLICPLVHPETDAPVTGYTIDTRRAVVQGKAVLRSRPLIEHWATIAVFDFDPVYISAKIIEGLMAQAGRSVGIGDFRPRPPSFSRGKGGPFGRFVVIYARVEEGAATA